MKMFDKDGNGFLKESELDAFLKAFEDEGLIEHSRTVEIGEKIREEKDADSNVIDMSTLWDYYDNDHNGYLDLMELKRFFYDLITKNHKEDNSRSCEDLEERIDAYVTAMFKMFDIKNGKVFLEDMCKFCPVEENFLCQFDEFDEQEFEEIFSHYDQDESNEIEGFELEGFLKDLYQRKHKPGQSFEKFKAEKLKKFDKDKNQKFNKQEVKNILVKST
ncbi:Calbindin-32 [Acropora cervicornis]|uniref:Calbindin-32 n=1 Tax=Acropora cervicornis TaxID=6130 RepID=A0AAD9V3A8_ACRCE|nr:Calbindin-32 [Acropora cervicornis]